MDINNKLTYLNNTKTAIKKAIIDKGVDVLDTDTFRSYAEKINMIQSGGSGGEVIEAIVDESVLPIEANKKVVVADIQATGQGAGALMPFDIMPYHFNDTAISSFIPLNSGYDFMINHSDSIKPTIAYKRKGDKFEGSFINISFSGSTNPNDSFNLIYVDATDRGYGSDGKYFNHITNTIEMITFDEAFPSASDNSEKCLTRYFLTHDSKYLWATHINTEGTTVSTSYKPQKFCIYEVHIDDVTGKVSATKASDIVEVSYPIYPYQSGCCALDHYGFAISSMGNDYSFNVLSYILYDETTRTITSKVANGFFNGYSFKLTCYTKTWVVLNYSYAFRVYHGDIFGATLIGDTFGSSCGFPSGKAYQYKDMLFSIYNDNSGFPKILKIPVDKENPTPSDFITYESTRISAVGFYFLNDEEMLFGEKWNYTSTQGFFTLPINDRSAFHYYDPYRVPTLLLDDGTGYFYTTNKAIYNGASLEVILPVNGSYNNGTVLKTINPSIPFYKMINTASTQSGQGFRFGTLPMNYINGGKSFVFHNYIGGENSDNGVTFFKSAADDPQRITNVSPKQGVRVSQNKAYITPYYNTSSDNLTSIIVCDEKGVNTYEVTTYGYNLQGVYFDFEGETYSYPLPKRKDFTSQGNTFLKMHFDPDALTCAWEMLGTTELDYLNQMGQYVTGTDMAPSNPYPAVGNNSLYDMPVITKDGKYFVGLAGNHTTHYSKIEKSPEGLPMLNVYEFPDILKNLLYEQEILYFEAYYPSGFGIQLANGTFLLCEYEQGLDVDLKITTYTPAHSYRATQMNQCLMHFTSHKHYWYFSAGTYWDSSRGSIGGYAGCGRREDLPSTYQTKVYSMKYNFTGADHVTGYLTGESYKDNNGKIIAEVEVLRK